MKIKKVLCQLCGTRNWSFAEYCQGCSGELYGKKESERDFYPVTSILE
ncbi:MAG: hypothetical protein ACOCQN_01415 [Halanaerobiaceae bacterium]